MNNFQKLTTMIAFGLASNFASATALSLTSPGNTGILQDAVYLADNPTFPTGSGVIDSFLRVQARNSEQGYNTDFRPVQFDELSDPIHTRSLLLSDLSAITIGTTSYYQFLLDTNEPNSASQKLITLTELQIFLGNSPSLTGFASESGFGANSTFVYSMDQGIDGDSSVTLNDSNGAGSGRADMYVLIPTVKFTGTNKYVYLYSAFTGTAGGFEEWATNGDCPPGEKCEVPPNETPEPGMLALIGLGLLSFSLQRRALR